MRGKTNARNCQPRRGPLGKAVKTASMIDEHTRESLLHLVERSITAHPPTRHRT
jgi:hypothetical protein